ncbi:MAG TPA: hypothetical protein VKC90_10980 [Chitinophagaceae bacterium]|nr:hypothetical protein [Chitinophagaceae bacterium]
MKQVLKRKSIIVATLFAVFSTALAPAAQANDSSRVIPVELKFLGEVKDQLVFQLNFDGNAEENEFAVTITDEAGATLYRENVKGEKVTKRYLLNSDEIGDGIVHFHITSKKSNQTVVYEVNHVTHVVQDVVVNKLK